jgi:hypothetical protein
MPNPDFSLLKKPNVIRVSELIESLQVIKDSLELISKGKAHQFIPIYGQLRSILTEKSKNQTPLLFELADLFNEKLQFYYIPFEDLPKDLPAVDFHFISPEISCEKKEENQVLIEFKEFLGKDVILFNSRKYNFYFILNALANKFGGSHYANKIENEIAQLFYWTPLNREILKQIVYQIAKVTIDLGTKVAQKLNRLSLYYSIFLPAQELAEEQYILDYYSKSYEIRYSLVIDRNRFVYLKVIDLLKVPWVLKSQNAISFDKVLNLQIVLGLNKEFKSVFHLVINNEVQIDQQIEQFIPISNEMNFFDCYYNRSYEKADDGLSYIMYETIVRVTLPDENETNVILKYMQSKNQITGKGVYFSRGNYGLVSQGQRDMNMFGIVRHTSAQEIGNGSCQT